MSKVLVPSGGPDGWKHFLAQPDLHWAKGYSARTLAHCWEESGGLPPEVRSILEPVTGALEPLLIIPERKTPLPGGTRESQSDAFLLARAPDGLLACTIEGKVDEPFGPTVGQQMANASAGKIQRLSFLCARLGLTDCPADVHYQLLHRTVSALIEADKFHAKHAAMVVHSFSPERRWFEAFEAFVTLLGGGKPVVGDATVIDVPGRTLILGWARGEQRFREI